MDSNRLIVAVDGGGSTCRVSICDLSGVTLGGANGGSANITTDLSAALGNIKDTIHRAYLAANLLPARMENDFAYLGLAGAGDAVAAAKTENALPFYKVKVASDRKITVQGAMGNGDGTVAAIGTGSFFVNRRKGKSTSIGGWGFALGDDCGGAILGRELLRHTLCAHDGIIAHSPLTLQILAKFGSPREMVIFARSATPMDYGSFAPNLTQAYFDGDPVAAVIVDAAVARAHELLGFLNTKASGALYLLGGLGQTYQALLQPEYQDLCLPPKGTAIDGAIALAQQLWGDST